MRIVIDGRWIGRTGIGRYVEALVHELQQIDHTNEYLVLLLPQQYARWRPEAANFQAVETSYEVYTWQEQLLLGKQLQALKPDLVHFTSFNLPIFYPGRFITTVHDLTLVHYKNARGGGLKRLAYEFKYGVMLTILRTVMRRAVAIIVPTQYVRDDVTQHYPVAAEKLTVTYEATSGQLAQPMPITRFAVPKRFVMYVGNYYPYKNISRLVTAFAQTEARQAGLKLILCGKTPYFLDQIKDQVKRQGLDEDVIITGYAEDGELATLYSQAEGYVFPSLCEGFGLPGLEAMAYGTPVLAARASCLPEVLGEAAEYCDPLDVADMAKGIDRLVSDKELQRRLKMTGPKRVGQFSWRRMAEETVALYRSV